MTTIEKWMGRIGKGLDKVNLVSSQVIFWGFIVVAFLWTFDAITRNFAMSLLGTYSVGIGKIITQLCPYLTAGYAMYALGHVRVTIAIQRLNERSRAWVDLTAYFLFFVFMGIIFFFFLRWTSAEATRGTIDPQIEQVKMWWLYALSTLGMIFFCAQILREMVRIAQRIASGQLARGTRFYTQPYVIVPVLLVLVGLSYWVFMLNAIAGMFAALFVLMFISVPMPAALGSIGMFGLMTYGGYAYARMIPFMAFGFLADPSWMTLPMFMLGGVLFGAGMGATLFRTIKAWTGWIPGGIGVATVWIGCVFGAIIGSINAAIVALIYFCLPELDKDGFPREFTLPMISASAAISTLIPPSIGLVIFGVITETSIGGCLMAGVGSGLLLTILYSIYTMAWTMRKGKIPRYLPGWKERTTSIPGAIAPLIAPVILIGGIVTGIFSPIEASCVMVVYILIASLATRKIKGLGHLNSMGPDLNRTLGYVAILLALIGVITKALTYYQIPQEIAAWVVAAGLSKWAVFAFLMIFFTLIGCVGEVFVMMIVTIPMLMPTFEVLGFHPFWLAIFFALQVPLGGLTPPVGGIVFIAANVAKVDPYFIFKGVFPWIILDLVCLFILFVFPPIATWLPLSLGFTP